MYVHLFSVLILDFIVITTRTDASPGWTWNSKSKHNYWNHNYWKQDRSKTNPICSSGQCTLAWKCPDDAISRESTGSCTYWTNGPWVCCDLGKEQNQRTKINFATNPSTPATGRYSKRAATNSWKQKSTTESYWYDDGKYLTTQDPWNRNALEKTTTINTMADILRNVRGIGITSRPVYGPTKNPLTSVRKTTEDISNKRITPISSISRSTRNKTPTTHPRIVFPTESISWTKKTTKHPAFITQTPKKVTDFKPTTKTWPQFTRSTTKAAWQPSIRQPGRTMSTSTRQATVPTRAWAGASSPRTTATTTRRNRITTPLPNVNTYMCGIRKQRPVSNRQGRSSNLKYDPSVEVIHSDSRGMRNRQPFERIVGGDEVEPFSWPWVAALYKVASSGGHRFLSAGSLINGHFVLTAAHVFTPDDLRTASYVVMLGTHDAQDAVAEYLVASVLQHPRYEHRYYYHDIALLRLVKPVNFNEYVMPVCLPSPNAPLLRDSDLEGKNVTVMGWGDESFGGKSSRVLREATFPIVPRRSCNASYVRVASNRFPRGITDEMLCAGDPNGGKDACQGDSGGPLTSVERGRYTQVGIVSFGYQCGDKEFPGVYTKVAPYLSWIAENTQRPDDYGNDYDYRG